MGKVKIEIYFYLTADILTKVLQKCSLSSPLPNIWSWIWLVAMATQGINSQKHIQKSSPQQPLGGWSWNFAELFITLASTKYVFIAIAYVLSLLWQSFHRLIMGKMKVGLYCYLIADILSKDLQRCSSSSPLPNIWILFKSLSLIGCHCNQKEKFAKKYSKIISSEVITGMKLKLCRNVHNISLYKSFVFITGARAFIAMVT